jgi:uncharacterized protein (DUF58 family)
MIWSKARVEFLVFLFLLGIGLALRHPGVLILAILLAWHFALGVALAPGNLQRKLKCERTVQPRRVQEGEEIRVSLALRNEGRETFEVFVADKLFPGLTLADGRAWETGLLKPGAVLELSYTVRASRGIYRFSAAAVEVRGPLGLLPWRGEIPCPAEVLVLPRYEELSRLELPARRTLPIPGTTRARRGGLGLEFHGVREFRPGDETKRIAWKAFARQGTPVVVEYEEERAADVAIVLDVRAKAYRGAAPELFDHAVRAAAALAHYHLRQGHRVGLLKYGAYLDWVFPGYGKRHRERILWELAAAKLGESEVFEELGRLPTRLIPAGSLILLISPLVLGDEEVIGKLVARGYRVFVVVPDPASTMLPGMEEGPEAELSRRILGLERWTLLRRIRRTGATVVEWDVKRPLAPLVRKIRPEFRVWR